MASLKSAPGWSLLVRPPVNLPRSQSFECYEGIVETDRWFGPLFVNVRLTATDRPIEINHKKPLFQVQPLIRQTYAGRDLDHPPGPETLEPWDRCLIASRGSGGPGMLNNIYFLPFSSHTTALLITAASSLILICLALGSLVGAAISRSGKHRSGMGAPMTSKLTGVIEPGWQLRVPLPSTNLEDEDGQTVYVTLEG